MVRSALLAAVGCLLVVCADAAPIDDLSSLSQQVRDAAAELLRTKFVPPSRSRWETVVAAINPDDSRDLVLHLLQPYRVAVQDVNGSGQSFTESYRLDDVWVLSCSYRRRDDGSALFRRELVEHVRHVWVAPPADFTGVWTTYFANGQRSHEIHYSNGRYSGILTAFHSNGSKAYVQHYGTEGADGDDTGYFPSGALMYRGQHRKGAQTGTWVHYNEDGSVRTITKHPARMAPP